VAECQAILDSLFAAERGEALEAGSQEHLRTCPTCRLSAERLRVLEQALARLPAGSALPPPFERLEKSARTAARDRRQRRALRRALPLTVALALAVTVTAGVSRLSRRGEGKLATAGQIIDGGRGTAEVTLADGAHLTVPSGRSVVEVSDRLHAVVRVETGSLFVSVPHLEKGGSFVLRTEEVEVRVHGTRFQVARLPQGTRVDVSEGAVDVQPRGGHRAAFRLEKGESRLVEGLSRRNDEEAAEASARLAWKLLRDGDRAGARERYRRALALLPPHLSPLWADNASAQLALLLEGHDPRAAAAAWRGYLDRFPLGVHAELARERLVTERAR
jgi:transmembrane sensor